MYMRYYEIFNPVFFLICVMKAMRVPIKSAAHEFSLENKTIFNDGTKTNNDPVKYIRGWVMI